MTPWQIIGVSIAGIMLVTFSSTYEAHPDAPLIAYAAAIAGSVGSYILGLFQKRPGESPSPPPPTLPAGKP